MSRTAHCVAFLLLIASPVFAQPSFYAGGSIAADAGGRGPVDVGTVPAAGFLLGWRFSKHWSLEAHLDRAFGDSDPRISEGLLFAQLSGPPPASGFDPETRDRAGVFGRSVWQDRAGLGWAALVVYTARQPGRVDLSVYAGVSERRFETRHTTTITSVGPDVTWPPDHPNLQNRDETRTRRGGGITGGLMVPVRLTDGVTFAPELRVTLGLITDESSYKQFYSGVRMMWGL